MSSSESEDVPTKSSYAVSDDLRGGGGGVVFSGGETFSVVRVARGRFQIVPEDVEARRGFFPCR
jgi:hypothetical protein